MTTFEETLDEVLDYYDGLIRKMAVQYPVMSRDEVEQIARITCWDLWQREPGFESVNKKFPKAFKADLANEVVSVPIIRIPQRRKDVEHFQHEPLDWYAYKHTKATSYVMDFDDDDDLVVEGAKRLVAQAMSVLSPIEDAVIRRYYLESDPREGTTDKAVSYEVSEESEALFGEKQSFTPWFVWSVRKNALDKMREELRPGSTQKNLEEVA